MSTTPAELMSGDARREEVARLLAQAIFRRRSRQNIETEQESSRNPLDCQRVSSVHVPSIDPR